MPRPPRFDTDQLLDAAVHLAATSGPAAVTMSAVAKTVGAPSGSVYHRFPSRTVLLAEVWLRTVERFQHGYVRALDESPAAAARHVVAWSRTHPQEATVLLYGPHDFGRTDWPPEYARRADDGNARIRAALTALTGNDPAAFDRAFLALIDLPLAVVRRHLRAGEPLPPHAEALAEESAAALLAGGES
ncbi:MULTISPECIES: TetR/AcrR family transcriptional regulator [Streptomyces]